MSSGKRKRRLATERFSIFQSRRYVRLPPQMTRRGFRRRSPSCAGWCAANQVADAKVDADKHLAHILLGVDTQENAVIWSLADERHVLGSEAHVIILDPEIPIARKH